MDAADHAVTARDALKELEANGWARVPHAKLGLPAKSIEDAHMAIWDSTGAAYRGGVSDPDKADWTSAHAKSVFGGAGGFTKRQFLPEQVSLQTHPVVESFYRELFVQSGYILEGPGRGVYRRPDDGDFIVIVDERAPKKGTGDAEKKDVETPILFHTYAERANITLPGILQDIVGQTGAKPHIDCNPWEADYADGEVEVDPAMEAKQNYLTRRWEIDRPFQSFVSLTDCSGGPLSGGMGVSAGSHHLFARLQKMPPHGRNPRWGNLTRMTGNPGGAWRDSADRGTKNEVDALHDDILGAMHYPFYRTGDMIIWKRETTHAGCARNFTRLHQARVYVNKLPLNTRNDCYAQVQGKKATIGVQGHGKAQDRHEKVDPSLLTGYQKAILGIGFDAHSTKI